MFFIGVAGGSGSGKSTVTEYIIDSIGQNNVTVINHDNYYKNLSHLESKQKIKINFDHPEAFDWELIHQHFAALLQQQAIKMPHYNFTTCSRMEQITLVIPAKVVIFEGIFALLEPEIRSLMALKIYVDTAADIRFIRRMTRDIENRGRDLNSIITQYLEYVRPMHKKFIDPTKRYADIIIPHGANRAALEMIETRVKAVLNNQELYSSNYFDEE